MKHVILMVVVDRSFEFYRSLGALKGATQLVDDCELVIVQQGNDSKINKVAESIDWIPFTHLLVEYDALVGAKERINANIRYGLKFSFEDLRADLVTIVEDDVLVGADFLFFVRQMFEIEGNNEKFRGVNAISGCQGDEEDISIYGKFRFGYLWGWSIGHKTWRDIKSNWTGNEIRDWDSYLEPYVKSGYVIMPKRSRVINIGFNEAATHTFHGRENSGLNYDDALKRSFISSENSDTKFSEGDFDIDWRADCVKFRVSSTGDLLLNAIYVLQFKLSDYNFSNRRFKFDFFRHKLYGLVNRITWKLAKCL